MFGLVGSREVAHKGMKISPGGRLLKEPGLRRDRTDSNLGVR